MKQELFRPLPVLLGNSENIEINSRVRERAYAYAEATQEVERTVGQSKNFPMMRLVERGGPKTRPKQATWTGPGQAESNVARAGGWALLDLQAPP